MNAGLSGEEREGGRGREGDADEAKTDGRTDGRIDRSTDRSTDQPIDRPTDRRTKGEEWSGVERSGVEWRG